MSPAAPGHPAPPRTGDTGTGRAEPGPAIGSAARGAKAAGHPSPAVGDARAWPGRAVLLLSLALVAVAATAAAIRLGGICVTERGLPMWDRASHGVAGVEVALALRHGDVAGFLLALNRQATWPFVHSLMLAPWLLARGLDVAAADQLSSLLFALTLVALFAAGAGLDRARGAWIGVAAAMLAFVSPLYRVYGTLAMLEMPGAFLLALTLALWIHRERRPDARALTVAAGLSTTALVLCKYNYGLLWLVPLGWHLWSDGDGRRRPGERLRDALRARRWRRPFPLFVLACALALVAIQLTGGGVFRVAGARVSVTSAGNPAYGLYVLLLGWAAVRVWRGGGLRAAWSRATPRARRIAATVLVPLGTWFLIPVPNRVRELVGFVTNREGGPAPWTVAGLLYYPQAFARDYSPSPLVGWIVLALACVPPRGRRAADRLLYVAFAFGLLATMAHRYHDPRFLFTTALLVWLRAAQSAVALLDRVLAAPRFPERARQVGWIAALALVAVLGWRLAPPRDATALAHRAQNSPAVFAPVVERVLARVDAAPERPVVLGFSNWMSPALLRWEALRGNPDRRDWRAPSRPPALEGTGDGAIAARVEKLRSRGWPVIAALPSGAWPALAHDYLAEVRGDSLTAARLASAAGAVRDADEPAGSREMPLLVRAFRFVPATPGSGRMTGP